VAAEVPQMNPPPDRLAGNFLTASLFFLNVAIDFSGQSAGHPLREPAVSPKARKAPAGHTGKPTQIKTMSALQRFAPGLAVKMASHIKDC
jgi:hypothetical protein